MSNQTNTDLLERAAALVEEIDSHPSGYDKLLADAVQDGDLDYINHLCNVIEGELAQAHFRNYNAI